MNRISLYYGLVMLSIGVYFGNAVVNGSYVDIISSLLYMIFALLVARQNIIDLTESQKKEEKWEGDGKIVLDKEFSTTIELESGGYVSINGWVSDEIESPVVKSNRSFEMDISDNDEVSVRDSVNYWEN